MAHVHRLAAVVDDVVPLHGDGIDPVRLANSHGLTLTGLAELARVQRNILARAPGSAKVQGSLQPIVRIIAEMTEMMDDDAARARVWFMTQPMGGWDGETAADVVRIGRPDAVRRHVPILRDGTYAWAMRSASHSSRARWPAVSGGWYRRCGLVIPSPAKVPAARAIAGTARDWPPSMRRTA